MAVEPRPVTVETTPPPPDNETLGNRIAELAARVQAATWELLVLIRQFAGDRYQVVVRRRPGSHSTIETPQAERQSDRLADSTPALPASSILPRMDLAAARSLPA